MLWKLHVRAALPLLPPKQAERCFTAAHHPRLPWLLALPPFCSPLDLLLFLLSSRHRHFFSCSYPEQSSCSTTALTLPALVSEFSRADFLTPGTELRNDLLLTERQRGRIGNDEASLTCFIKILRALVRSHPFL